LDPGVISGRWPVPCEVPNSHKNIAFGFKTEKHESVATVWEVPPRSELGQYMVDKKESIYASVRTEPVGKAPVVIAAPPAYTQSPDFPGFGRKSDDPEGLTKVMQPDGTFYGTTTQNSTRQEEEQISKPRRLGYDWQKCGIPNPDHHSFGKPCGSSLHPDTRNTGVYLALNECENSDISTKIGLKRVEDHKMHQHEALGKVKNQTLQDEAFNSGIAFGSKAKGDVYTAKDIIQGWYALEDQMPDPNIGAVRKNPGSMGPPPPERTFGLASVRTDKVPPKRRNVADHTNYGDETGANSIIFPARPVDALPGILLVSTLFVLFVCFLATIL
jgi:hypothetical protein